MKSSLYSRYQVFIILAILNLHYTRDIKSSLYSRYQVFIILAIWNLHYTRDIKSSLYLRYQVFIILAISNLHYTRDIKSSLYSRYQIFIILAISNLHYAGQFEITKTFITPRWFVIFKAIRKRTCGPGQMLIGNARREWVTWPVYTVNWKIKRS